MEDVVDGDVMLRVALQDKAAMVGIGYEWDVSLMRSARRCIEMQDEVMCERGRENERSAFDRQGDGRLDEAGDVVGIGGAQRWCWRSLHGRQADDEHGLGIVKGRRHVEAQIHRVVLREGDGRDVLVRRSVQVGHDADEVNDGADVRRVESAAGEGGVASGCDEVGAGPVRESGGDGLAVAVVEKRLRAGLGEAGELHVDGLLEAGFVRLESEGAREQVRVLLERVGIGGRDAADVGEVLLDAGLLEAGFGEVL